MPDLSLVGLGVPVFLLGAVIVIAMATLLLHLLFPPAGRPARRGRLLTGRIRCPLCNEYLDGVELGGVGVQGCPDCQGVWLSQDKLQQIIG
jgi:hypothetical protein